MSPREIVRLGVCHVPEGRQIFPELTVAENFRLGAIAAGSKVDEARWQALVFTYFPAWPNAAERAWHGRVQCALLHVEAGRHPARQPEALVRHQQPQQLHRAQLSHLPLPSDAVHRAEAEDVGADHPILQEGFAFVDAGWHADAVPDPTGARLVPNFPVATQADGSPITGRVRIEHQPSEASFTRPLVYENGSSNLVASRTWRPYEPVSADTAQATLTVRDRTDAPRIQVASDR